MSAAIGIPLFGLAVVVFAVMSFRLPVLRMPSWPHVGVTLFCTGIALVVGPASVSIPDTGPFAGLRMVLILVSAAFAVAGILALLWIPRRLQERLPSWDAEDSQPWLDRRTDEHK